MDQIYSNFLKFFVICICYFLFKIFIIDVYIRPDFRYIRRNRGRVKLMQDMCFKTFLHKKDVFKMNNDSLENVFIENYENQERYDFAYCHVQNFHRTKHWKKIKQMVGIESSLVKIFRGNWKKHLGQLNDTEIRAVISKPTVVKFLIVRHPFERLVHVFREEVEDNLAVEFMNNIRKKMTYDSEETDGNVSFKDFVDFIVSKNGKEKFNRLWIPITELCDPCSIKYNYIAHFDTILDDTNIMMKRLSSGAIEFVKSKDEKDKKNNKLILEYFCDIPISVIHKLNEIYKHDYKLFGFKAYDFENICNKNDG